MRIPQLTLASAVVLALLAGSVDGAQVYRVPLMKTAPTLDGRLAPNEWAEASGFDGFTWQGRLEERRVQARVGATMEHLYVAVRSELPKVGMILARVKQDTPKIVFDDSVEIWIDPMPDAEHGKTFQVLANSIGRMASICHVRGRTKADPQWQSGWKTANGFDDGWWVAEFAVPLASMAPGRKATQGTWAINVCRNWKQPWQFSSLAAHGYRPGDVRFRFGELGAPAVQQVHHTDPTTRDVRSELRVRNPGTAPVTVKASLVLERSAMPAARTDEELTLEAGQTKSLELAVVDESSRRFTLTARVTSVDGTVAHYDRTYEWGPPRPRRWETVVVKRLPIDFLFSHYPYLKKLRVLADWSGLKEGAKLQRLTFAVRKKGATEPAATFEMKDLEGTTKEETYDVPTLEGEYELAMMAAGQGVGAEEVVKMFERKTFPWEHGRLGKSRKVYPPFKPIEVGGRGVRTVLSDHRLTALGLWERVKAAGQELMAGPMQLTSNGREATPGTFRFTQTDPDRVKAESSFALGPLTGRVETTWDYDGMMKADLMLEPTGGKVVEDLVLEVPLSASACTHYHAMGDGIRNTLYERVPAGRGVVWTSAKVNVNDFPKSFCSYIFLGSPKRGLSWFCENDAGWSRDPAKPNVELVRASDVLTLRVHLVNKPIVITGPRTITFGLLAAPVKPRLPGWRHKWLTDRYTLLGTDINWLALGNCGSVYPAKKDMYLWEMIREGNRRKLSKEEVQKVIDHGRKYFEPYGDAYVERYERHVRHNLQARYGKTMVFYYNRATYAAAEEYPTFKDEWICDDYSSHEKSIKVGEIKLVPSDSYIDYALYWYGKSFDVGGNHGVYWDNWYFRGSFNRAMTAAYRRPDGSVMPSNGIWGLRELAKRTFQYMNERGMPPITMAHMTSTNVLPLHSFCTVTYDWEWKYSQGDVQYRFPRDYILLVSNGELAGTWPVLLNDHGKLARDPWTQRTFAGVTLVHELIGNGLPQVWDPLRKDILRLQQTPGVQAHRYWDERPRPVVADHADLPGIVYVDPGKEAVYLVTSYAEKTLSAVVTVDPKALGFTGPYTVADIESGKPVAGADNRFRVVIKKHDVRLFRLTPAK